MKKAAHQYCRGSSPFHIMSLKAKFRRLLALTSYAHWIIYLEDGGATVTKGKPSRQFIIEALELLASKSIHKGKISGVDKGGYIGLEFSSEIPSVLHQPLRNVWGQYANK
jgi:hypothetical protein